MATIDDPGIWTIYFIRMETFGLIRIGRTCASPLSRVATFQDANPELLTLIAVMLDRAPEVREDVAREWDGDGAEAGGRLKGCLCVGKRAIR